MKFRTQLAMLISASCLASVYHSTSMVLGDDAQKAKALSDAVIKAAFGTVVYEDKAFIIGRKPEADGHATVRILSHNDKSDVELRYDNNGNLSFIEYEVGDLSKNTLTIRNVDLNGDGNLDQRFLFTNDAKNGYQAEIRLNIGGDWQIAKVVPNGRFELQGKTPRTVIFDQNTGTWADAEKQ